MNEILRALLEYLESNLAISFGVKKIRIGTPEEAYNGLMHPRDLPFVLLTPDGAPVLETGVWANTKKSLFNIKIFIFMDNQRNPNDSRIIDDKKNNITLYQVADELLRLIGNDKQLNGLVTRFPGIWDTTPFTDEEGRQILEIRTQFINDLVPFEGAANNQTNLVTI
jgi:hypothetical protein